MCVDCIKGKQTKHTKKGATRSTELLEIIHTDICGPFDASSFGREKYFITFINDFLCYTYIYLLHEKSQVVEAFTMYITEVESQLERNVKIIRSGIPQQNGVAEKRNHTLIDMVRSMLHYYYYYGCMLLRPLCTY